MSHNITFEMLNDDGTVAETKTLQEVLQEVMERLGSLEKFQTWAEERIGNQYFPKEGTSDV